MDSPLVLICSPLFSLPNFFQLSFICWLISSEILSEKQNNPHSYLFLLFITSIYMFYIFSCFFFFFFFFFFFTNSFYSTFQFLFLNHFFSLCVYYLLATPNLLPKRSIFSFSFSFTFSFAYFNFTFPSFLKNLSSLRLLV